MRILFLSLEPISTSSQFILSLKMKVIIAIVLISQFVGLISCVPADYNQQPASQPLPQPLPQPHEYLQDFGGPVARRYKHPEENIAKEEEF
jgi:hypothetical protein